VKIAPFPTNDDTAIPSRHSSFKGLEAAAVVLFGIRDYLVGRVRCRHMSARLARAFSPKRVSAP
jgi:hypothetical protein